MAELMRTDARMRALLTDMYRDIKRALKDGVKFQLPVNGLTMGDISLKNMSNDQELRLPFPLMALEYESTDRPVNPEYIDYSKMIVVARDADDCIFLSSVFYSNSVKKWGFQPYCMIPKTDYIDNTGKVASFKVIAASAILDPTDYADEAFALFDLLNALACKNVHIEKSQSKATKQGKKVKTALPFDDYHFLTVDVPGKAGVRENWLGGSHRSPREHLRRGHIRTLESGPIWVNACVVNAGIGSEVGKSYLLRNRNQSWR